MWRHSLTRLSRSSELVRSVSTTSFGSRILPRCNRVSRLSRYNPCTDSILNMNAIQQPSYFHHGCYPIPLQHPCQLHQLKYFSSTGGGGTDVDASKDEADDIQIPGAQTGGRKLAIIFTCTHCNTRSAKQFTERSYKHGVVIATCPGCKRRHLIADNIGFFADEEGGWNIEKGMAKLGENVRVATNDDVFELTVEDIYTKEVIDAAVKNATDETTEIVSTTSSSDNCKVL